MNTTTNDVNKGETDEKEKSKVNKEYTAIENDHLLYRDYCSCQ